MHVDDFVGPTSFNIIMPINGNESSGLMNQQLNGVKVLIMSILLHNQRIRFLPKVLKKYLFIKALNKCSGLNLQAVVVEQVLFLYLEILNLPMEV